MTKIENLESKFFALKDEAQKLLDNGEIDAAQAKYDEAEKMKRAVLIQKNLDDEESSEALAKTKAAADIDSAKDKTKDNANFIRAALKKISGANLTDIENSLLLPTTLSANGVNGEGYILPQDIKTIIHKKIRQYKSFRDVIGYIPTSAIKGSFPVENFETVSGLVDFEDGTDGTDAADISFTNKSFSLKEKAAFINLSNTLLSLSDNALIEYIADIFAKKAMVTENTMAIATLKSGKSVKTLADWKALKSSINKDLDPAVLFDTVIVTNQDGFDILDSALDDTGRPILQPNPTDPTRRMFMGFNVVVFSNAMLATVSDYAPVFYGNLKEGVKLVDLETIAFKTSSEAGFMRNTTVARLIEFVDMVQVDSSDKCYVYGQMSTVTPAEDDTGEDSGAESGT